MRSIQALAAALALLVAGPCAAQVESNAVLAKLQAEDQADREAGPNGIDWSVVGPRDEARRSTVTRLLRAGEIRTAADYHAAALVFQHGTSAEDIQMAYSLASVGSKLDPSDKALKWLTAAAWDRFLMRHGRPQWYGTQYRQNQGSRKFELYPVDESAVTDKERVELGVPTLEEAKAREAELNR